MKHVSKLRQELNLWDQISERQIVQPIQKEEDYLMPARQCFKMMVFCYGWRGDQQRQYASICCSMSIKTESEKAKECERTMFGICKDKYTNLKAKGLSF